MGMDDASPLDLAGLLDPPGEAEADSGGK